MQFTRQEIESASQYILSKFEGSGAIVRADQITAIESVLIDGKRTLLIQQVGWGKSLVYWTSIYMLRSAEQGIVIIICPLLALIMDQMAAARTAGLRIDTWNSTNAQSHENIRKQILDDELDALILTPEQLSRPGFLDFIREDASLVVIDEAHCISQWGYSFRPDYLRIGHALASMSHVRVLATTATCTTETEHDITAELGGDMRVIRGPLTNPSLSFNVVRGIHRDKQIQFLDSSLCNLADGGIIYTFTKSKAISVSQELALRGHKVAHYHADLPLKEKRLLEMRWRNNELKGIVSTSALGMGINKKDVPFVINIGIQPSITDYFQQTGRAGRNGQQAFAVLIPESKADKRLLRNQPTYGLPDKQDLTLIYETLKSHQYPMSANQIALVSKVDHYDPLSLLKLLASQNAVQETIDGWYCIDMNWTFNDDLHDQMVRHREKEIQAMHDYTETETCLEQYLCQHLGDTIEDKQSCGQCLNCRGELPEQFKFSY